MLTIILTEFATEQAILMEINAMAQAMRESVTEGNSAVEDIVEAN